MLTEARATKFCSIYFFKLNIARKRDFAIVYEKLYDGGIPIRLSRPPETKSFRGNLRVMTGQEVTLRISGWSRPVLLHP